MDNWSVKQEPNGDIMATPNYMNCTTAQARQLVGWLKQKGLKDRAAKIYQRILDKHDNPVLMSDGLEREILNCPFDFVQSYFETRAKQ